MFQPDLEAFIAQHITDREESLCRPDIEKFNGLLRENIEGKSMLVIGGAGSIGSAFIKAVLSFAPGKLTIVDHNENGLTELIRDLRSTPGLSLPDEIITYPFDFGSPLLEKLFEKNRFDIIASFAAHKHVRSEKDVIAIEAMMTNNLFNTHKLFELASKHSPEHIFAVSTDKAANPVNVMGCTKKLMEDLILAYSTKLNATTARFANVAFSNGSLPDGFIKRMNSGQPITAPTDVKRYFVSPAESGDICMIACMLGNPGEIFFPKLIEEEMKSFADIADAFLKTQGYEPDVCRTEEEARNKAAKWVRGNKQYPVYYFKSDTTGEKPYEEFFTAEELPDITSFQCLGIIRNSDHPSVGEINERISQLQAAFSEPDLSKEKIIGLLKEMVPGFDHLETGKYLDSKM